MTVAVEERVPLHERRLAEAFLPEKRHRLAGPQQALHLPAAQQLQASGGEQDGRLQLAGTACAYGRPVDRGYGMYLVLEPGCFAEQVPYAGRVKVLWQHRDDRPLGLLDTLDDGPGELRFTGWISGDPTVAEAANAAALLGQRIIDEVSVGFRILRYVREEDSEADTVTYRIVKAHLDEVSLVTWGAMERDATVQVQQSAALDPDGPRLRARAARLRLALAGSR